MPYLPQLQVQNNTLSLVPGNAVELPGGGGNVADWAQDPAVANIDANGNELENVAKLNFLPSGIVTSSGTQLLFNGAPIGGGGGPPTTWSQYPATQPVFSSTGPLTLGTSGNGTVIVGTTTAINTEDLLILSDAGGNITNDSDISLIAENGFKGAITIQANPGADIPVPPISGSVGGLVNIQANSGTSIVQGLSRVNVEAATVSIEAGALGSLAFVPGSVNLLSGLGTGVQILTTVGVINIASGVAATLSAGAGVFLDGGVQGVNVAATQSLFVDKVEPRTSPGTVGIPELNIASPDSSITFGTSGDQITAAVNPAGSFTSINGVNTSSAGPSLVVDDLTAPFLQTTLLTATDASIVNTLEMDATGVIKTNKIEPATGFTTVGIPALDIASPDSSITFGTSGNQITATVTSAPISQALANKLMIVPYPYPVISTTLNWSTGQAANEYVPLAASTANTSIPPIDPGATGTGWRFQKTYTLLTVSAALNQLVAGDTYTIVAVGSVNWTAIGATAGTAGTQFTYNGVAVTGTGGTATTNQKMSWYSLNALFGLSLPQTVVPAIAVKKSDLRSAWFLVKFNQDIALQGSLAIQIETYAYQYNGNTTNAFTGRWAYSFPLSQGVGFNASATTNITNAAGFAFPRLKAGFTYLLYAGDITPTTLSVLSGTYQTGGANLFAPSQVSAEHTLRDPYDLFAQYPHFGMTSVQYTQNAIQPSYGGVNPYADQADVEVASIYLNTSSTSPGSGVGQTVQDYNVLAFGYSGVNPASQSFNYTLNWV